MALGSVFILQEWDNTSRHRSGSANAAYRALLVWEESGEGWEHLGLNGPQLFWKRLLPRVGRDTGLAVVTTIS